MTDTCNQCGEILRVGDWPFCPHGRTPPQVHSVHASERAVVFRDPRTGRVSYPGRNDDPTPAGYVREELPTLRALNDFSRREGVRSYIADHDPGKGRSNVPDPPKINPEVVKGIKTGTITGGSYIPDRD